MFLVTNTTLQRALYIVVVFPYKYPGIYRLHNYIKCCLVIVTVCRDVADLLLSHFTSSCLLSLACLELHVQRFVVSDAELRWAFEQFFRSCSSHPGFGPEFTSLAGPDPILRFRYCTAPRAKRCATAEAEKGSSHARL